MTQTTDAPKNFRLEVKLRDSNDTFYNEIYYLDSMKPISSHKETLGSHTTKFFDEYIQDSFIDDSDIFQDTLPFGMDSEHKGFYINKGPLVLKQDVSENMEMDESQEISPEKVFVRNKEQSTKLSDKLEKNKTNQLKVKRQKIRQCMNRPDHVYAKRI